MQNTLHQLLIKIIPIVQDTAVQNFTLMQNTLYSNCPIHSAELNFNSNILYSNCPWHNAEPYFNESTHFIPIANCPRHNAELYFHATNFTVQCKWYNQCLAVLISVWVSTTMYSCTWVFGHLYPVCYVLYIVQCMRSVWLSISKHRLPEGVPGANICQ